MDLHRFIVPQTAIQNLDFLRRLITELRGELPYADMEKLRMLRTSQSDDAGNQ